MRPNSNTVPGSAEGPRKGVSPGSIPDSLAVCIRARTVLLPAPSAPTPGWVAGGDRLDPADFRGEP